MADDLNAMAVFVAVIEAGGFRAAGTRLGVTASAVSQTLRRLEEQLGVVLLRRTTRSVHPTEAGERLYASVRPALEEVRAAIASVGELSEQPRGTLRIVVSVGAESFLDDQLLSGFLAANPLVRLELAVSDGIPDIVASGYDAGLRLGEVIDRDMVAVPVSGDVRLVVVGAPSYFDRHPKPTHPRDLVQHACINWHPTPDAPSYRWEFTEPGAHGGHEFTVAVPERVLTTDPVLITRLARAGVGLAMLYESQAREAMARGELVPVLEEFSTSFPGFYLYYPQRRQATPALKAFVEHLRGARQPRAVKRGRRANGGRD
ncbi:LysR family transcriptional regulator [Pyxidicoccus fallax]|uniref:LysR family transcriptional regulator n=1 Tax=Pyxidicoccus fallax TaxID=394095 RepID=A0A848L7K1_9BACT|nr:LysR family transcriptional regulator [Pyxidicoccus fallax]NMO14242.1 LysR family transcriptional regulator [Pyxidicoccus fallax]NPC78194.1 LysR family transcriptional regulator [Pyxidicoccus fallax]